LHLCRQSGTGCKIFEGKIPIDEHTKEISRQLKFVPSVAALSGGEDYELLFTVKQEDYDKIKEVAGISVIGHMTGAAEGKFLVTPDGKSIALTAQGWDGMKGR
jgi:thiamine-monophosphate kinase